MGPLSTAKTCKGLNNMPDNLLSHAHSLGNNRLVVKSAAFLTYKSTEVINLQLVPTVLGH
jgi:hypothetical protein